jgi:hypothetical protein
VVTHLTTTLSHKYSWNNLCFAAKQSERKKFVDCVNKFANNQNYDENANAMQSMLVTSSRGEDSLVSHLKKIVVYVK